MINVGIIGYGYWGPNLLRNFSLAENCRVKTVVDMRQERLKIAQKNFPSIHISQNADDIFNDKEIDAVVVATPVFLHHPLAKKALQKGKHVLIEKPMTASTKEANELIKIAQQKKLVLMVDHTFLYTGAVRKIKQIIDDGTIGDIKYFDSTRINLGLFQPDINVIWDLAPHDISILEFLVKEKPYSVNATGISHTKNKIENVAYLTLNFQSNIIAHFNCSWTSPVKIRTILIGGSKKMILFDDVEPTEKVKVYDTGYSVNSDVEKHKILVDYRAGDIFIPKIEQKEALSGVTNDFINAIAKGIKPVANFESGLYVVKVLEAAEKSIKQGGKEIKL